ELSDLVDIRILVDDHSSDNTVEMARLLGLGVLVHDSNYGYGRDQQTCYREALAGEADIVVMLHPDHQYTPLLVTAMSRMIAYDVYDVVLGSRISDVPLAISATHVKSRDCCPSPKTTTGWSSVIY